MDGLTRAMVPQKCESRSADCTKPCAFVASNGRYPEIGALKDKPG
jgi:hypothetical protein